MSDKALIVKIVLTDRRKLRMVASKKYAEKAALCILAPLSSDIFHKSMQVVNWYGI